MRKERALVFLGAAVLLGFLLAPFSQVHSAQCPGDLDCDGEVHVSELIAAVRSSLDGCPVPEERYVDNGDGTVTDNLTGLMWEQKVEGSDCLHCIRNRMDWHTAMGDWISQVNGVVQGRDAVQAGLGGYTDWRVPTIDELRSLIDCDVGLLCLDPVFGPHEEPDFFFSSTSVKGVPLGGIDAARAVLFNFGGIVGAPLKGTDIPVRAVRRPVGSGCEE